MEIIDLSKHMNEKDNTSYTAFNGEAVARVRVNLSNRGFGLEFWTGPDDFGAPEDALGEPGYKFILSPVLMEYVLEGAVQLDEMARRPDVQAKLNEVPELPADDDGDEWADDGGAGS